MIITCVKNDFVGKIIIIDFKFYVCTKCYYGNLIVCFLWILFMRINTWKKSNRGMRNVALTGLVACFSVLSPKRLSLGVAAPYKCAVRYFQFTF